LPPSLSGDGRLKMRDTTILDTFSISSLPTLLMSMSEARTNATPEGETFTSGLSNFASGMRMSYDFDIP